MTRKGCITIETVSRLLSTGVGGVELLSETL